MDMYIIMSTVYITQMGGTDLKNNFLYLIYIYKHMYIYIDIFMYRIPDSKIYSTVTCKIIDPTCICTYIYI